MGEEGKERNNSLARGKEKTQLSKELASKMKKDKASLSVFILRSDAMNKARIWLNPFNFSETQITGEAHEVVWCFIIIIYHSVFELVAVLFQFSLSPSSRQIFFLSIEPVFAFRSFE